MHTDEFSQDTSLSLFLIYVHTQDDNIKHALTTTQDNRIALALEKRIRWREKVKSSKDAVRSVRRKLEDVRGVSLSKTGIEKKMEGWMQMEVRSGSNLTTYWQRFYFTIHPRFKCLSWFTDKKKEIRVGSIYLSPSCSLSFRLKSLEEVEDDNDTESFRIRGMELPADWNKMKWSASGDEDIMHLKPESNLSEWHNVIISCCEGKRTELENESSERSERVMELRKRKLDTIEYVLKSEIQKQTQIVNALHHRNKHIKESGYAQEIRSVEIWFRVKNSGPYQRQVFRVTRGMTFGDLTSTAGSFWKKLIPKSIGMHSTISLKDSTGSTWALEANVQIELTNCKRITEYEPRLYLSVSKLRSVTPREVYLQDKFDTYMSNPKRSFRTTKTTAATSTTKNVATNEDEERGSKIFESQNEKIIFGIEFLGVVLFLLLTYLNTYVNRLPQMASYHASKYVKHKLVDTEWQECFESADSMLLAGLYTKESAQTCRSLSFESIYEVSQIMDWARGIWFFEFGRTGTPSDREFFSSMNTNNYQATGNENSSIYTLTGTQILGEMLIWTVRNSDNSTLWMLEREAREHRPPPTHTHTHTLARLVPRHLHHTNTGTDLDNPSSESYGNCSTSRSPSAICWSYETDVYPSFPSTFSSFDRDYDGDGFVIRIPASPHNYWLDTLNEMSKGNFFDTKTRAVGFTANLWSENSGTLFTPQIIFEFDNHGAIVSNYRTTMFRVMGEKVRILVTVFQVICLLTCLAPLYVITRNVLLRFKKRRKENLDNDQTLEQPGWWCSEQSLKFNWYTRIDPALHAIWGSLQGSFLFQAGFVFVYILVVVNSFELNNELDNLKSQLRSGSSYIDVETAQDYYRNVTVLRGFAFLFALIKSIEFLRYIPAARPLVRTLSDSFPNLVAAFILLMTFRIALVTMAMSLYGVRTWRYNKFVDAMFTMFEVLLGNVRGGETIWGEHFVIFEFTLWTLYIVVEFYTWYLLILVVLTFSYKKNSDEFLRQRGKVEIGDIFPCFSSSSSSGDRRRRRLRSDGDD